MSWFCIESRKPKEQEARKRKGQREGRGEWGGEVAQGEGGRRKGLSHWKAGAEPGTGSPYQPGLTAGVRGLVLYKRSCPLEEVRTR